MKLPNILKNIVASAAIALPALLNTGCNGLIYDDQGDCDPYYKVKFVYDYNTKFADAFAAEVNEVTLYVIDDATGQIVWQKHESGDALKTGSYMMDVDVDPGTYTLLAWCGEGHTSSFAVAEGTQAEHLRCNLLDRQEPTGFLANGKSHVRNRINRLYHCKLDAQVFPAEQGVHTYEMHLTKDTNLVKIHLQHLSGEPIDQNDYTYTISEDNGLMDHDNSLLPDEELTYFPWDVQQTAGAIVGRSDDDDYSSAVPHPGAVASFTTGRLMQDRKSVVRIYNDKQEMVAKFPLIDLLLMVKTNYSDIIDHHLTNQEYLDYKDEWEVHLLLDENGRWTNSTIYIENWKIVFQNSDV